eukprot:SAG31_NODE_1436_length_8345_cov_32.360660_3_plen_229_part_00
MSTGSAAQRYRRSVVKLVPWIKQLDFAAVTSNDRVDASRNPSRLQTLRTMAAPSDLSPRDLATGKHEKQSDEADQSLVLTDFSVVSPSTRQKKQRKKRGGTIEQEGRSILKRLAQYIKAEKSNVVQIFRMFDIDGSGDLDDAELHAALVAIGMENISRRQVRALMQAVDDDGSGTLDVSELLKAIRRVSARSTKEVEDDDEEGIYSIEDIKKVSILRQQGNLPQIRDI